MITFLVPAGARERVRPLMDAFGKAGLETQLTSPPLEGEALAALRRTTVVVGFGVPCGPREMDAMPGLQAVVSPALGYEWIDVDEATRRGIAVANGEVRENRESMAEATIMLLLALLYRLPETQAMMRDPLLPSPHRRMLKNRTVGVVGYGGIAREILKRLAPWGCRLLVSTRGSVSEPGVESLPLEELLAASDAVLVMTRLDPQTRHMLDRRRLELLKPGAVLVNTARGAIVDEGALMELLTAKRVGAAALDVFETEPLPQDHPLRNLPNVILTPHAIGHTIDSLQAIPAQTMENVTELVAGRLPASCKNPGVEQNWRRRWHGGT